MPGKCASTEDTPAKPNVPPARGARRSLLLDTRTVYCGDCLDQLAKLPDGFVLRRHAWHRYIDYMRPRSVELARVLKKTGSTYYHCDRRHRHGMVERTLGTD